MAEHEAAQGMGNISDLSAQGRAASEAERVEEEKEWRRRVMEIDAFIADIEVKYYKPMT